MIWGAHWCLIFYLFSTNVKAPLSSKLQTEKLASAMSALEDTEPLGVRHFAKEESFFSWVSGPSHPVGMGNGPLKRGFRLSMQQQLVTGRFPIPSRGSSLIGCQDSGKIARIGV